MSTKKNEPNEQPKGAEETPKETHKQGSAQADTCPTCGQEPTVRKTGDTYTVECKNCVQRDRMRGKRKETIVYQATGESKEEAIENWNTGNWSTDVKK